MKRGDKRERKPFKVEYRSIETPKGSTRTARITKRQSHIDAWNSLFKPKSAT